MDDLDGLFSSAPTSPGAAPSNAMSQPAMQNQMGVSSFPGQFPGPSPQVPVMPNNQMPSPMMNNSFPQQAPTVQSPIPNQFGMNPLTSMGIPGGPPQPQPPSMPTITPTQTVEATQLNNKTQILNQFQSPTGAPRPAPGIPAPATQQPGNLSLMQSPSFTEPGPVEFEDNFFGSPTEQVSDSVDGASTFYIEESNQDKQQSSPVEVTTAEEDKHDGEDTSANKDVTGEQPERKTSFWSGLWNRNKDQGSKENILEETEKKDNEDGRGGNEQKFVGDGQTFKGKLIGVLEVKEARGDRMCQDALQELKMAIKASGEHKQRVNIQIAVDGLKIRDEKSGDCLYHHPVHKISFIAQDMSDNRAFGYVYGSPENGHRFFGIKTEKAAGQVVVAMRDLFQVVFEMKKKEIDEAKQNMESESLINDSSKAPSTSAASFPELGAATAMASSSSSAGAGASSASKNNAIDDLLGLETELNAIQAGIQQIDKIAPNAPMSFPTDNMLPLNMSMPQPQQQQQQPVVQQPRKPVAVMNQNPPVSEFGTAPFLPPPPSRGGRKQEAGGQGGPGGAGQGQDRYAVFDNVQRYAHNNNILQQQSSGSGAFGNAFMDEGPGSIFNQSTGMSDSGPASLQTQNNGMFGGGGPGGPPPVQQQQIPQQQRTNLGAGVPPKSNDLASLFTDLDPLGTGTSKPFVDKKDFFTANKKGLKLTGASDDSLNNVGLNMSSDPFFVDHNLGMSSDLSSDPNYTNSFLSSSSVMSSSKYSDSFWSSSNTTPRPRTTESLYNSSSSNTPSHQQHAAHAAASVPKIHTETWEPYPHYATSQRSSQRSNLSGNTLRVALPPEEPIRSSSPGINTQNSNTYGSILELEASPRRFRKNEIPDFYAATQDSFSFNYGGRYGAEMESADSSLSIPMPSEPPPALPQRPPKLTSVSPPPLPPKKQSIMSTSTASVFNQRYELPPSQSNQNDDIYDFIHENTGASNTRPEASSVSPAPPPLPSKENDIPLDDLVRMSVVELSQRMLDGKLPHHLSGMSLFELVEYISKQTREMNEIRSQTSRASNRSQDNLDQEPPPTASDIKSSFSDNFVSKPSMRPPQEHDLSQENTEAQPLNQESQNLSSSQRNESIMSNFSSSRLDSNKGNGFDDDFSKLNPSSSHQESLISNESSTVQFDKYAVFRELQMEEEISNAWKSPTGELPELSAEIEIDQNLNIGDEEPIDSNESLVLGRFPTDPINIEATEEETSYYENDYESNTIPAINIENNEQFEEDFYPVEEVGAPEKDTKENFVDLLVTNRSNNFVQEETFAEKMGNGQATFIEASSHDLSDELVVNKNIPSIGSENTAFEENFSNNFQIDNSSSSEKCGWATFEDERSFEFSSFLSKEEQNRLLNKSAKENQDESRAVRSNWEPTFQTRSQSTDPTQKEESLHPRKFDPFSNRPGTEPPKEWSNAWNDNSTDALNVDEAFPSSTSGSREKSQNSLRMSNDSIFNNPFTDNFVTLDRVGAVSSTPPVFEGGEVPCDRASNNSRISGQSEEFVDTMDVFDENNSFANSNFKIQAKTTTKLPNSESVDIFKVSADPFDDDFFK